MTDFIVVYYFLCPVCHRPNVGKQTIAEEAADRAANKLDVHCRYCSPLYPVTTPTKTFVFMTTSEDRASWVEV